ncbi:AAA family ATPase [Tsukamurella paurometabola]|nr:AAA family ATPase [Tsukamurella paurometabola]
MKIVSFFNHKGGVGKTTLIFNIGIALARAGRSILFVDADPQANLTSLALPAERYQTVLDEKRDIYHALLPVIKTTGDIADVTPELIRDNVWILPGHIRLSEFEGILPESWTSSLAGRYNGFQQTTAIQRLILSTVEKIGCDFVLIDVGPSVGALNRVILLGSDGFVVPLAPDLFSITALPSVGKSLTDWVSEWRIAREQADRTGISSDFVGSMLPGCPIPIGYISQQFASYRSAPTAAFKEWYHRIPATYDAEIPEKLSSLGIATPKPPGQLGTIRNLSSLVPRAQESNSAIFELSGAEARGAQYIRARDTFEDFSHLASAIESRLEEALNVE